MSFAGIAIGVGLTVSAGASIFGASKQSQIANSQLGIEQDQEAKQDQAFQQLQQLISNPGAFFNSPVYKAAANAGGAQVARNEAAGGFLNSGNEAVALQSFGQQFGQSQLFNQEQLLAGMSGTGFNPSAAGSAASGATSASTQNLNSLAGLLSFFGTSGIGAGIGGGSSSTWATGVAADSSFIAG
jgi:aminopeptidase N